MADEQQSELPGIPARKPALYVASRCPGYTIHLTPPTDVVFVNGKFETDDPAVEAELDGLMKKRPDIRSEVQKVDLAAAAAVVARHRAAQKPSATQGAYSTVDSPETLSAEEQRRQSAEFLTGALSNAPNAGDAQRAKDLEASAGVSTGTSGVGGSLRTRLKK